MRKSILAVLICGSTHFVPGQHRFDPVAAGAGGVWLREGGDPWAALGAAPLLAGVPGVRAGVAHFPGQWDLGELRGSAAVIAAPLGPGGIGASVTRFGYELYSETAYGLACGAGAGAISCGAGVRYTHISAARHGTAGILSVDAALIVATGSWLQWGMRVTDLNRPAVGGTGERLRESASIAVALALPGGTRFLAEAGRDGPGDFAMRAGLAYEGKPVSARIGTSGTFDMIHCGAGIAAGLIAVGYGVVIHPDLGWSHRVWLGIDAGP